jgi:hypothetical protein
MRPAVLAISWLTCWAGSARGSSVKWIEPSASELAMKDEPKAPGAPAIVLSYEQIDDGETAELTIHVRIKVLTEGGVSAGDIEIQSGFSSSTERDFLDKFSGRTIHADGTVVPFVASESSTITKENGVKAIALPQVQVGSILEYVIHYEGRNTLYTYLTRYYAPDWALQGKYFFKSAHYVLKVPPDMEEKSSRWVANLPPGAELKRTKNRIELSLADVPAAPDEAFMPPASAARYSVRFFYYDDSRDKYWGATGDSMDYWWSGFDKPTKALVTVVHDLTLPTDSDEVKLRKLYGAVQKFENTDLTRTRTRKEDEKAKIHEVNNSEDVWNRKRGDFEELTLLFIALARAAGYESYPMAVASRGKDKFDQNVLTWSQMDGMAAIVVVKGHEVFFDPGTPMCPFAHMAPWHANVIGVSTEAKMVKIRTTPAEAAKASRTDRTADITLAPDGTVSGTVKVVWSMNAALKLRQQAIEEDQHAAETALEKQLQGAAPQGTTLKLQTVTGWADGEVPLVATFAVTGKLGQATRKRMVVPAQFFASSAKPPLIGETRTQPIEFPEAYMTHDQMQLHLPAGFQVESLPAARSANVFQDTLYGTSAQTSPNGMVITQRAMILNRIDYRVDEYATLHKYFGEVGGYDQEQVLIQTGSNAVAASQETSGH